MTDGLKLSLAALAAFLLGLFVGSVFHPTPPDVREWEARVAAYQRDSVTAQRVVAVLIGRVALEEQKARNAESDRVAAVARADVAQRRAIQNRAQADQLKSALATKSTAADSVPVLVAVVEAQDSVISQLETVVSEKETALTNAVQESLILRGVIDLKDSVIATVTNRLAIADDLLGDRPQTDRCRVLWFDCPSRTTTFIVGAVLGVVGGFYVANR